MREPDSRTWRTDNSGHLIHDGDCLFWDRKICTCGLLHHLLPRADRLELYPDFWTEQAAHSTMIDLASTDENIAAAEEAMVQQERELTPEEQAEFDELLGNL